MSKFVWKCVATFLQRCELINVRDTTVPLCDNKLHEVWFYVCFQYKLSTGILPVNQLMFRTVGKGFFYVSVLYCET